MCLFAAQFTRDHQAEDACIIDGLNNVSSEFRPILVRRRAGVDDRPQCADAFDWREPLVRDADRQLHAGVNSIGRPLMPQTPGKGRQPISPAMCGFFMRWATRCRPSCN